MGNNRSIPIPARMSNGAPGNRACTSDFKIKVVNSFLKERGATEKNPATVGLGISVDEIHRARTESNFPEEILEYPLIDLRLTRRDCERIIRDAGLPIPPKSACYFCPFKSRSEWKHLKSDRPQLFDKAVKLELRLNEKRGNLKKDWVYIHPDMVPLSQAVANEQMTLDQNPDENCESGYCMT
jgi:PP-loop superfamily ATP-utilizing enzyme